MEDSEHLKNINRRLDYLKKFYPFFKIYTSSSIQKLEYDAPLLAIDILTLLIEKGRLLGRAVSIEEIEAHIKKTLAEIYPGIAFDNREVTKSILGILETDSQGMLYQYQYFDSIHRRIVDEYIQLIEFDLNESAYRITDTGLDFMISTKELPEESKISITLILFKKQIENGSFRNALTTIQELNLAVQFKRRKKEELLEKLMTGGPDIVGDFEKYSYEVLSQLKQENELFTQVHILLKNISENQEKIVSTPEFLKKEEEFIVIKQIADAVEHGYNIHNELLKEFTDLPGDYQRINHIRLNSLFERRYQFQEALENHIRSNIPNEIHIVTILPLLNAGVPKKFNLLKIFEPQVITGQKIDIADTRLNEEWTDQKGIEELVKERQAENFKIYSTILLVALARKNQIDLSSFIEEVRHHLGKEGIENIDFIPFLLELNSNAEVQYTRDNPKRDMKLNPFENLFDLLSIQNLKTGRDQIEEALYHACGKVAPNYNILRIISQPDLHVKIGENDKVRLTDMVFMRE